MKKQTLPVMNVVMGMMIGLFLAANFSFVNDKRTNNADVKIQAPELPEQISFAGETVPLQKWDVKERLDREILFNYYQHANILYLMKLSARYFPVISERLKANGVPDDFKYLCVAESNLMPTAISRSGATSFWQFMPGTAPGFGIEMNKEVDKRYDLVKATDAACVYLKTAYSKFGSWTAAAASYNMGQGGYQGQAAYQGSKNYYDLLLPEETNRYMFRILAFKYLLENARAFGFHVSEGDRYDEIPFRQVSVSSSIPNLAAFAREHGTDYKTLRLMNPWLRGRSLSVSNGRTYTVKLPVKSF